MNKPFVGLIILDGLGLADTSNYNAVSLANMTNLNSLINKYPNTTLKASGLAVGLPEGQMGNSEVGHLNLGAGRVIYQSLTRLNKAISDNSFYSNQAFLNALDHVNKHNSQLHILGLAGTGGVHAHSLHLISLNKLFKDKGITPSFHLFTDGRDTAQKSGYNFIKDLLNEDLNISSLVGRYYAMDRDNNWNRINMAYDLITKGKGKKTDNLLKAIIKSYDEGITDEFIKPIIINSNNVIKNNDAVIFANFRPDRAIRLSTAISNPTKTSYFTSLGKDNFHNQNILNNIFFVSMMHYHEYVKGEIAFPLETYKNLYGDVISKHNLTQVRIAETEKYPHVTFFFDGGIEKDLKGARRILVESPKVKTYDLKPEMSAYEVKEKAVDAIKSGKFNTMILNFANPDMVGHTGNLDATIKACKAVDDNLKDVVDAILEVNGYAIILADHGNAEQMLDENGNPHTAHTTNLVPCIVTKKGIKLNSGALCDIAPTMLDLLNIKKPSEMTGTSLIKK